MPIAPNFSLRSHHPRGLQSGTEDSFPPDHARGSPQPPSTRPGSNPSPRLAGSATRDGAAALRAPSSEALVVDRSDGRATSHSQTGAVPLFTAEEVEAASPGRRFMNIHRRARRERARSGTVLGPSNATESRPYANNAESIEDYSIPLPVDTEASSATSPALTGASLRRGQYAAPGLINSADSGQHADIADTRVLPGSREVDQNPASAQLGASSSAIDSVGLLSGRGPGQGGSTGYSIPINVVPRADITILVAPPPVHLTTSHDALQRLTQGLVLAARSVPTLPRSAATSAQTTSSSAAGTTSSSCRPPAAPVGSHSDGEVVGSHAAASAAVTCARAFSDDDSNALPTFPACEARRAVVWQLPILTITSRGHVARPSQHSSSAASLRSVSSPSRSAERSTSRVDRTESVDSQRRSVSQSVDSRACLPRAASSRSSREVSWVQHITAAEDVVGRDAAGQEGHVGAALSNTSASTSTLATSASDTRAALGASQSPSACEVSAAHLHLQHRLTRDDGDSSHGCGGGKAPIAPQDSRSCGRRSSGGGVGPHRSRPASRPVSLTQAPPALVPASAAANAPATPRTCARRPYAVASDTSSSAASPTAVHLPTAKNGVVLLSHVRDGPAQGELYRLLRVFYREPLQQFPQALPGPPLAVRLPSDYDDDDDDHDDRENGGNGDNPSSVSSHEHAEEPRRRSRSPYAMRHGSFSRRRSRSSSVSTRSSASQMMVEVNASNPRELFSRLLLDPADCAVEVRGLPSRPTSTLPTSSPRRSRRSRTSRSTHRGSQPSTPVSYADRSFDRAAQERQGTERHARSAFTTPARNQRPMMSLSGRSINAAGASACQAEVVANGFFNAELRQEYAESYEAAAGVAEAEYGEGCYYTLPLIPLSSSPLHAAKKPRNTCEAKSAGSVSKEATPGTGQYRPSGASGEKMELLPCLSGARRPSSSVQRGCLASSASSSSGDVVAWPTARSMHGADWSNSLASRENMAPDQLTPELPKSSGVRSDMLNPRSTSLRSRESLSAAHSGHSLAQASMDTPRQISCIAPDDLQASQLNGNCVEAAVTVGAYQAMARVDLSACAPVTRSDGRKAVDGG